MVEKNSKGLFSYHPEDAGTHPEDASLLPELPAMNAMLGQIMVAPLASQESQAPREPGHHRSFDLGDKDSFPN